MVSCLECTALGAPHGGVTGFALAAGALVVCPCHLPITIGLLAAAGTGTWVASNVGLVYGIFGALFIGFLVVSFVWVSRRRDREVAFDEFHETNHGRPPAT